MTMPARLAVALAGWGAAACGATPPVRMAEPQPAGTVGEAWLLGPLPRSGCFHVSATAPGHYRFEIDDVEYPRALGAGHVAIIVHATDMDDLAPRPITRPRVPQLTFEAEGEASGAFEITLFLVDGLGRDSEPAKLDRICDTTPR
jgi:hypothetical protein